MLPTNHGFDEFFGNLYHLNAEEETGVRRLPEEPRVPQEVRPARRDPQLADGRITDTGPLTKKRMETIDEEVTGQGAGFHAARQADATSPSSCGGTHAHARLHAPQGGIDGKDRQGIYADGMVEHDAQVGCARCWLKLKGWGWTRTPSSCIPPTTAPETFTWPDGGTTMFRGEKNTNWEGGYRVPTMIRWPGVIKPGTLVNDIGAHEDMLPTW